MGVLRVNGIADTAGVAVSSEVQGGCFHVAGDTGNSLLKLARVPTNMDPVFRCDRYNRFH